MISWGVLCNPVLSRVTANTESVPSKTYNIRRTNTKIGYYLFLLG
jgi:hypothetical protein